MQITSLNKLSKKNVIFHDAVVNKYGNKSIKIEVKTSGRERGPLVIESPLLFSFGVQKSVDEVENLIGYSIPTCLWSENKETSQKELDFYNGLKKIEELCYQHLEKECGIETAEMLKIPLMENDDTTPSLFKAYLLQEEG